MSTRSVRVDLGARGYDVLVGPGALAEAAKRVRAMTLWIDRTLFLPTRVRYVEGDGDVTEYRFQRLRVNGTVPEHRFTLDLPASVEVRILDLDRGFAAQ